IRRWINKNGKESRKVIGPAMQQEQTRLRGDCHPNFIGDLLPGAAFETLFGQKNLHVFEQFGLIRDREPNEECDSRFNDFQPLIWKRPRLQPFPMSIFEKAEHLGTKSLLSLMTNFALASSMSFRAKSRNGTSGRNDMNVRAARLAAKRVGRGTSSIDGLWSEIFRSRLRSTRQNSAR